jgi:hypothetical protein
MRILKYFYSKQRIQIEKIKKLKCKHVQKNEEKYLKESRN